MIKIGDTVRIQDGKLWSLTGKIGTVVALDDRLIGDDSQMYVKLIDYPAPIAFWPSELGKV